MVSLSRGLNSKLLTKLIRSISNTKLFIIYTSFFSILGRFQNNILRKKAVNFYTDFHSGKILIEGQQTIVTHSLIYNSKERKNKHYTVFCCGYMYKHDNINN